MKKIGLDASTTTVGYAFVDDKTVIDIGFIPINKEKTIRDKVHVTLDTLNELCPFEDVDKIYIEDNLSGFSRGRTSQQTIIKLAKFNAVLVYCLEFGFGEIVEGVHPMTARKKLFGYRKSLKDCDVIIINFLNGEKDESKFSLYKLPMPKWITKDEGDE